MTGSVHDILGELRSVAYDARYKGDRFERLTQAYLTTEPQYVQPFDEVWMWTDYPQRGVRIVTGVDLVARARDKGEPTAIQCEFFDPSTGVTKPALVSFLAASSKNLDGAPEFTESRCRESRMRRRSARSVPAPRSTGSSSAIRSRPTKRPTSSTTPTTGPTSRASRDTSSTCSRALSL